MADALVVLQPRYLSRFGCLGAACEDHCCAGWQGVDVDRPTYLRYQDIADPTLRARLRTHLQPSADPAAPEEEFGVIEVPSGGACPFLASDRLCGLQRGLGEELLPVTCDTFPRQASSVNGTIELSGRLSCPEIARLALLDPDALMAEPVGPDRRLRDRARFWLEFPWPETPSRDDPRNHYHLIRARACALLSGSQAPLERRILALGRAMERLSVSRALDQSDVESAFQMADYRPHPGEMDAPEEPDEALFLLLTCLRPLLGMRGLPVRYRICLDRLRAGLRPPTAGDLADAERLRGHYAEGLARLERYHVEKPWVLENWLCLQVLGSSFPFHPARDFIQEWGVFALRFAVLKAHLAGAALAEGSLTDELLVETAQAFDKYVDSPEYWERVRGLLSEPGLSVAAVATRLMVAGA